MESLVHLSFIFLFIHTCWCQSPTTTGSPVAPPTPTIEYVYPTFESYCGELKSPKGKSYTRNLLYFNCLPYITNMAKGSEPFSGNYGSELIVEPPSDTVELKVLKVTMGNFHVLGDSDFRPDIELSIQISWVDPRLKWNYRAGQDVGVGPKNWNWNFETYPVEVKPASHFWGPKISQKSNSKSTLVFELFNFYKPILFYNGTVNVSMSGQLVFGKCQVDVTSFPYDKIKCCTEFLVNPEENNVRANTDNVDLIWDTETGGTWTVQTMDLNAKHGKGTESLEFCVLARRNTNSLGIEISIPMGVSAIVMMVAQMAGKWRMQTFIKLFALFLQVFSFQTMVTNEALAVATQIPTVYKFYNFTIGVTLYSLVQTLIFWAFTRRWYSTPPPNYFANCLPSVRQCLMGDSKPADPDNSDHVESGSPKNGYRVEWEHVLATWHAVLSVLLVICYIIGVIILYSKF